MKNERDGCQCVMNINGIRVFNLVSMKASQNVVSVKESDK